MMDKYLTLQEIILIIESITGDQLLETANEILAPEQLSRLIFKSSNNNK
jgi:predicted Zn-dependent peptidase